MRSFPALAWLGLVLLFGMMAACASWPEGAGQQRQSEGGGMLNWPGPVVDSREVARSGALSWPDGPSMESPSPDPSGRESDHPIVKAALGVKGRPYRLGATGPEAFDCSGLVQYAHKQAGISIPRTTTRQFRQASPVDRSAMSPGDVVFFAVDGISISHVGLYAGEGRFIHSPSPGSSVSWAQLDENYWSSRFAGAGRFQ